MPVSPVLLQDLHPQSPEARLQRWHTGMAWLFWKGQHHTSTEETGTAEWGNVCLAIRCRLCSREKKMRLNERKSRKSVNQGMACHRLINDSTVLTSPQLHWSQALHWAFSSLPLTTKNFSHERLTRMLKTQVFRKTEHKKQAERGKLSESKHQ